MSEDHRSEAQVLIVEDDAMLLDILNRTMQDAGFAVKTAQDGKTALERICGGDCPLVILLDMTLPDMSGLDVIRSIHNDRVGIHCHCQIIILSNTDDMDIVQQALDLGASKYFIKAHYTPKQISERVRDLIQECAQGFCV